MVCQTNLSTKAEWMDSFYSDKPHEPLLLPPPPAARPECAWPARSCPPPAARRGPAPRTHCRHHGLAPHSRPFWPWMMDAMWMRWGQSAACCRPTRRRRSRDGCNSRGAVLERGVRASFWRRLQPTRSPLLAQNRCLGAEFGVATRPTSIQSHAFGTHTGRLGSIFKNLWAVGDADAD